MHEHFLNHWWLFLCRLCQCIDMCLLTVLDCTLQQVNWLITTPTVGLQSIVMSLSVCPSLCLSICLHTSKTTCPASWNFLYLLPVAIFYVLPVLWMMSCLPIMGHISHILKIDSLGATQEWNVMSCWDFTSYNSGSFWRHSSQPFT